MEAVERPNRIRTFSRNGELIAARRELILRCALSLFVKTGYHETTTRQLAQASGIGIGGIYHYVGSKKDILCLVADNITKVVADTTRSLATLAEALGPTEALRISIRAYYELVDRHRDIYFFVNTEARVFEKDERGMLFDASHQTAAHFEALLKRGIEAGDFRTHNPSLLAYNLSLMFPVWATRRWYLRKLCSSLDDYIVQQTELVLEALTPQSRQVNQAARAQD